MIFFSSNIFYKICQNKDFFFENSIFWEDSEYIEDIFFRIYWRSIEFYIKISILFFSYKHLKKISKYEIIYLINQKDDTASAIGVSYVSNYIHIPRSIRYESKEYVVTSVSNCAFTSQLRIKFIKFGQDSEIWMIESNALAISKVEQFYLPASVIELKEGWCRYTVDLKQSWNWPKKSSLFCHRLKIHHWKIWHKKRRLWHFCICSQRYNRSFNPIIHKNHWTTCIQ